jgi:hypothetical protein
MYSAEIVCDINITACIVVFSLPKDRLYLVADPEGSQNPSKQVRRPKFIAMKVNFTVFMILEASKNCIYYRFLWVLHMSFSASRFLIDLTFSEVKVLLWFYDLKKFLFLSQLCSVQLG